MGVTAKTLANHRANARAALSWFAKEANVPLRGSPLSEDWARRRDGISHRACAPPSVVAHAILSARGIALEEVDETALDA